MAGQLYLPLFSSERSSSAQVTRPTAVFSQYLMNHIPRGTKYAKLMNSLLTSPYGDDTATLATHSPQVLCSLVITESRLDDELDVATITFTDTPKWLRDLNTDVYGFPKKTRFGTLWSLHGASATAIHEHDGQTEFMRAVVRGTTSGDFLYAEMLAEFSHIDVNVRDKHGWTALHWACAGKQADMVQLCLSVPDCAIGLTDHDGLTAFDIALRGGDERIQALFYASMFEMEKTDPLAALMRVLTLSSEAVEGKPVFPGEAIFDPILDRNSPLVVALLNRGIDLTTKNEDGNTALHVAAGLLGNAEITERLLQAGSDIDARGLDGATALHHAARIADLETVQLLLDRMADATIVDQDGEVASDWAPASAQQVITRMIQDGGRDDILPLVHAGVSKKVVLSKLDPDINQRPMTPTLSAPKTDPLKGKDVEIKTRKISHLEFNNSKRRTALIQAIYDDDLELVHILLSLGAQIEALDQNDDTALIAAAASGATKIVEALLTHGADINHIGPGKTALALASEEGHISLVKRLLAAGANVETGTTVPLETASENGHTEIVGLLLAAGARAGRAIVTASLNGHVEIVKKLLAAGADANKYIYWRPPMGVQDGYEKIIKKHRDAGVKPNEERFSTPLGAAAHNGHLAVVEELLAAGADIDRTTEESFTPLQAAVNRGHRIVVEKLLAAGADVNAYGMEYLPLQLATEWNDTEIVRILKEAGASEARQMGRLQSGASEARQTDRLKYVMGIIPRWSDKLKFTSKKSD